MKKHPLSRRAFLGAAAASAAALPGCETIIRGKAPVSQAPISHWPDQVYRRFSVDIHVPDWDPALLSHFDAARYVECMARAGNQSLLQYTNSHVGLCLWRTAIGQRHAALCDRDFFGEVVAQ